MIQAYLIYNPTAGQIWSPFDPQKVIDYLAQHQWEVTARPTDYAGHGAALAREAAQKGVQIVIAAGGDGTINEVVQGLAGTETRLAILPVGTTNVLARELGISLQFQLALEQLPSSIPKTIDLGKMNHRYFVLMAGIGYDAELLTKVDPGMKKLAGKTAVFFSGVRNLFEHKPFKLRIQVTLANGKKRRLRRSAMQLFVFNAATYATDFRLVDEALMDDGILNLLLFRSKRFNDTFISLFAMLIRRHREWADAEALDIKAVQIHSRQAVPVQLDGDTVGTTPVNIQIVPAALTLLRPRLMPS